MNFRPRNFWPRVLHGLRQVLCGFGDDEERVLDRALHSPAFGKRAEVGALRETLDARDLFADIEQPHARAGGRSSKDSYRFLLDLRSQGGAQTFARAVVDLLAQPVLQQKIDIHELIKAERT